MLEEIITKSFIGIEEGNDDEYLLQSIDLNSNINKHSLSNLLKDTNGKKSLNKNINDSKCSFHNVEYFKDSIKDINIVKIEKTLKKISDNYNEIINILEEKIKQFKKRNDEQILLSKKIIDIYNSAINSDNITYQIILNTKNILKFNPILKNEFFPDKYQINLEYNILEPFSIDNFIEEQITIQKIQKTANIKFKEEKGISSLLFLEEMNKLICYNDKKIISFNLKDYSKESEIKLDKSIISLNLMKDKTIYVTFSKSIKKLKFINNKMIIEDYLDEVYLDTPGKIIKYKDGLAWTNGNFIGFNSQDYYDITNQLHIEWSSWSGYEKAMLFDLIEYKNDNIIFLYSLEYYDHHGQGGFEVHLGSYKKELSNGEQIDLESADDELYRGDFEYLNKNYKLSKFKRNKIIVFTVKSVFIINICNWEIAEKIKISKNNVVNCYHLNYKYYLFLLKNSYYDNDDDDNDKKNEEKNIIFMKIDDKNKKILFESSLNLENYLKNLYYINKNNENYIITHTTSENGTCQEFSFFELINMKNNKKLKIDKN